MTVNKRFCILIAAVLTFLSAHTSQAAEPLIALCYHDIQDTDFDKLASETMTITTGELVTQFEWLRSMGYTPVSLAQYQRARNGLESLPHKPVMLTFDDGYASFYTRVYPLLKLYNYSAVLSLVGDWLEQNESVTYGEHTLPRNAFLSWEQIKEMVDSGLVGIASHTYDLHRGVTSNPQNNQEPAAVTRIWSDDTQRYEDDDTYRARIREDLKRSIELIKSKTGYAAQAVTWPYGEYNEPTTQIAKDLGLHSSLTLDVRKVNSLDDPHIHRLLIGHRNDLSDLVWQLTPPQNVEHVRVLHADLDYVYDPDAVQQEKNLGALLDRIKALDINTVFLQAFADPDGNGVASELYFPNRHLPVRADLFNRVAWQIRTRTHARVYAWMPVLAFDGGEKTANMHVLATHGGHVNEYYRRLSPFNADARNMIKEIYEDLGKHAHFAGVLFHDDAFLTDYEDSSPAALAVYRDWGLPGTIDEIRASTASMDKWTQRKTTHLIEFTQELADILRRYQPRLKTARNLYARVVLQPQAEAWMAQNLEAFVKAYDYTAIMAMPLLEGETETMRWFKQLVQQSLARTDAKQKLVFELQSMDWRTKSPLDEAWLNKQFQTLRAAGIGNYGYYPDDFVRHRPDVEKIRSVMSLGKYPY